MALSQDTSESDIFIPETINLAKQPAMPKKSSGGCC
jgi:hypothetical protein